jgi:hypothetical protein
MGALLVVSCPDAGYRLGRVCHKDKSGRKTDSRFSRRVAFVGNGRRDGCLRCLGLRLTQHTICAISSVVLKRKEANPLVNWGS